MVNLCNVIFLVIKDLWEVKTYPEMVGTKEREDCIGEDWQELARIGNGEHSTGETSGLGYGNIFCDLAAGSLNDMLNVGCGS